MSEINQELVDYAYANLNRIPKGNKEYEKMILGLPYDIYEKVLILERYRAHEKPLDYANFRLLHFDDDIKKHDEKRAEYLRNNVFGKAGEGLFIEAPFYVDYGYNVSLGKNFYANFNVTFLDCSLIIIGDNVLCGPNVSFITATHPTDPLQRLAGVEYALPITVGNNVWFSANVVVLPGVTIGDGAVIGAGSVVNKDIESNAVAVGVPAKVIKRHQTQDQKEAYIKEHVIT